MVLFFMKRVSSKSRLHPGGSAGIFIFCKRTCLVSRFENSKSVKKKVQYRKQRKREDMGKLRNTEFFRYTHTELSEFHRIPQNCFLTTTPVSGQSFFSGNFMKIIMRFSLQYIYVVYNTKHK